jgi:hypothetical protein
MAVIHDFHEVTPTLRTQRRKARKPTVSAAVRLRL